MSVRRDLARGFPSPALTNQVELNREYLTSVSSDLLGRNSGDSWLLGSVLDDAFRVSRPAAIPRTKDEVKGMMPEEFYRAGAGA